MKMTMRTNYREMWVTIQTNSEEKGTKEKRGEEVVSCCQFAFQYKDSLRPTAPDAGLDH